MSPGNVAIVRGSLEEAAETGQPALRRVDPEVEWHTLADLPDSDVYRGHEGVAALVQQWNASFEDPRFEVEEYIDRGDCVVVPMILTGRVRGSEQDVAMPETWVVRLRDGMIVEVREYRTVDEGLEAVGPQE